MTDIGKLLPELTILFDASGCWGCGAWNRQWFHLQWTVYLYSLNIATKELISVVIAAEHTVLFSKQWQGKLFQFKADNMAVVHVLSAT